MKYRLGAAVIATVAASVAVGFVLAGSPVAGQGQPAPYKAARTADGKPNLNGIWQANTTANFDLEPHAAKPSPVIAMGAAGA
ncbi:MAG: hypothetical protein GEU82_05125, partial [Luteitalea sp.]|nr:hypothetical protein [Luteitalea sp.]